MIRKLIDLLNKPLPLTEWLALALAIGIITSIIVRAVLSLFL